MIEVQSKDLLGSPELHPAESSKGTRPKESIQLRIEWRPMRPVTENPLPCSTDECAGLVAAQ